MKIKTLKKRKDFVLSNKFGQKFFNKNFILQKFSPTDQNNLDLMFGFTATKKIGNAVKRNRAKRRIRHAIKELLPKYGKNGYDYVVVATIKTNKVSWKTVLNDLEKAFREIK